MTDRGNAEASTTMITQPVPPEDLRTIQVLHERRLGWSYMLQSVMADKEVGFPCEAEELRIRRELKRTMQKVSEWFQVTARRDGWPAVEGWMWEIDFARSQAVPKRSSQLSAGNAASPPPVEGSIMTLGDVDLEVIKRLLEQREALADALRVLLRRPLDGASPNTWNEAARQLGAASNDVQNWFARMADEYQWPGAGNEAYMYRVDVEEATVHLMRK